MKNNDNYIVTLDNNKRYVLINTINYKEKDYIYLANIDEPRDIIIGEVINDEIKVIEDGKLLIEVMKEFKKVNQEK